MLPGSFEGPLTAKFPRFRHPLLRLAGPHPREDAGLTAPGASASSRLRRSGSGEAAVALRRRPGRARFRLRPLGSDELLVVVDLADPPKLCEGGPLAQGAPCFSSSC